MLLTLLTLLTLLKNRWSLRRADSTLGRSPCGLPACGASSASGVSRKFDQCFQPLSDFLLTSLGSTCIRRETIVETRASVSLVIRNCELISLFAKSNSRLSSFHKRGMRSVDVAFRRKSGKLHVTLSNCFFSSSSRSSGDVNRSTCRGCCAAR